MAAKVVQRCFVWLLLVAEVVRCETHRVRWTVEGVEQYQTTPLEVRLSDTLPEPDMLLIECIPGNFSNILEVSSQGEFNNCDSSSSGGANSVGECHGIAQEFTYPITQNSGNLNGVVDFRVGTTVYFASYSDGRSLPSAIHNRTRGGQCLMGLKLAVKVVDPEATTPPPTTAAPTTTPPPSTPTPRSMPQPIPQPSPSPIPDTGAPQDGGSDSTFLPPVTRGIISGAHPLQAYLATIVTIFMCTLIAAVLR